MTIKYREESKTNHAVYYRDDSDSKFNHLAWNDWDYDILADDAEVDDYLLFQQQNSGWWRFWKLEVEIDTAVAADTLEWVWECRYIDWSRYWRNFEALEIVEDTIDNFSSTWTKYITFKAPDKWDNDWVMTWTQYYHWSIRYRITDIDNVTEVGKITDTNTYPDRIVVDDWTFTMADVYQADIDNWWWVVTRDWETSYTLNCWLLANSNTTFNSKSESITFIKNNLPAFRWVVNIWELTDSWKPTHWTLFRCEWANTDYNSWYLWWDDSTYYDTTIKFPREERNDYSQWFWWAWIWSYNNQKIVWWSFSDFRSYGFSATSNIISGLTYAGTFTEPAWATLFDMVSVSSTYWARPNTSWNNRHIHRFDLLDVSNWATNPWKVWDWYRFWMVDCKINYDLPIWNFRAKWDEDLDAKVLAVNSFQANIVDTDWNWIWWVEVWFVNKNNTIVNILKTNEDWYISNWYWTSNDNSDVDNLRTDDFDFTDKRFKEILFTSGNLAWTKRILHKIKASWTATMAEKTSEAAAEWDRFIEIPYIIYRSQLVPQDWSNWYEDLFDEWPFIINYRQYWKTFFSEISSISSPVNTSKVLVPNNLTTLSYEDALDIDWITLQDSDDEDYKYELDCWNNAMTDVYQYLQAKLSTDNTDLNWLNWLELKEFFIKDWKKWKVLQAREWEWIKLINYIQWEVTSFTKDNWDEYVLPLVVKFSAPNLVDWTRVQIYNTENDTELDNVKLDGDWYSNKFTVDWDNISLWDNIRLRACWQDWTKAKMPIQTTWVVTTVWITFPDIQKDDWQHNQLDINWADVDNSNDWEITADLSNIQIDIDDWDNTMDCKRWIAWWRYITTTEWWIRSYNPDVIQYNPDVFNIIVNWPLQIENTKDETLFITWWLWKRADWESIIADSSKTVIWTPNDRVYKIEVWSWLSEEEHDTLMEWKDWAKKAWSQRLN